MTDKLAEIAGIAAGQKVLDVGSGVGGPARRITAKYGAQVWGVELSQPVSQTAVQLTELVVLQDLVRFKRGSAHRTLLRQKLYSVSDESVVFRGSSHESSER